jgi:hypothetical protein
MNELYRLVSKHAEAFAKRVSECEVIETESTNIAQFIDANKRTIMWMPLDDYRAIRTSIEGAQ